MPRYAARPRGAIALALTAMLAVPAEARTFKEMFPGVELKNAEALAFVEALDYRQGKITLNAGGVVLNVPGKFYFLGAEHARKVIVEAWGNPPATAEKVLGMILPADKVPVEDTWGAVVTFDADGYVSDEEAGKIDYTELLKTMQAETAEASAERVTNGFASLKLIGWAAQPFYDKAANKLHWAKELEFGGQPDHTLNYDVRALGRHGVLKMNFVAGIGDLPVIRQVIPAVVAMPEFEQGARYQDFIPGTDKVAAYGIGGLIAGKLLAKAGLLAAALVFLKKGWVIIFLALAGLGRLAKGWFGRKSPPSV